MSSAPRKSIAVVLEHRFYRVGDAVYTRLAFSYTYWKPYLAFFDEVTVVARVQTVKEKTADMVRMDGPGISVDPLPYYLGPAAFLQQLPRLLWTVWQISGRHRYFLLRSGNACNLIWPFIRLRGRPYLREYPGNVREGVVGVAGGSFWIRVIARALDAFARIQARDARANSYVSNYCRRLYPSKRPGFVFSSFRFSEIPNRKSDYRLGTPPQLVSVGRLEGEKGHEVLLTAVAALSVKCQVVLIGDGRQRTRLELLANQLGVEAQFLGTVTDRKRLFQELLSADVFVLPSLTEGMPRALLEAMAAGMPCLATAVGGVPEVLDSQDQVPAGSTQELVTALEALLVSESRRRESGQRNLALIEREFGDAALRERQHAFWAMIYE